MKIKYTITMIREENNKDWNVTNEKLVETIDKYIQGDASYIIDSILGDPGDVIFIEEVKEP